MLGAYGVAMNMRFNGFGDAETAVVQDAPDGLYVRSGRALDPLPRAITSPGEERKVAPPCAQGPRSKKRRKRG